MSGGGWGLHTNCGFDGDKGTKENKENAYSQPLSKVIATNGNEGGIINVIDVELYSTFQASSRNIISKKQRSLVI